MFTRWIGKPGILGLSLSATLAAAVAGCGGQPTETGDAVIVPDPSVSVSTRSPTAAAPAGTGAPSAAAAPATSSAAAPTKAEGWGTLKGQITFSGTPEPPKVLQEKGKAVKNPDVCAVDAPILSERLVVDAATKGVKNVLIYLPRPTAVNEDAKKAATGKTIEFDQKHCVFEPHVLGLMTGVPVTMKSSDPTNHNVNVKLKNSQFNSTIAAGQTLPPFVPAGAERSPGSVICDIHPWMTAWIMVLDHPYIAVTDAQGYYEIKNVPAGTQKVVVWQEAVKSGGFVTPSSGEDVAIKAGDATIKDFTIDPGKLLPAS